MRVKMREKNRPSRKVIFLMDIDDYDNMKATLQKGQEVSSFIRLLISNEIERLKTYNKEKNQTWDIEWQ